MTPAGVNGQRWRGVQASECSQTPSPTSMGKPLITSPAAVNSSPFASPTMGSTKRFSSGSPVFGASLRLSRDRSSSSRQSISTTATFAPRFISYEPDGRDEKERVKSMAGDIDLSGGKRYVWVKDAATAFVRGWVVEELDERNLLVQCDDGTQREVDAEDVDKVNPAKFDKVNDMAELTHLNEPAVVHNLYTRYQADLIHTYSGLFLVTINPYCSLPIYTREYINMYRGRSREDTKPHIFAMADEAFRSLVDEGENQSILVTGESGAGKTENTKKVIQYLAAVAASDAPRAKGPSRQISNLAEQILKANPILEAFGNAQTVRNNNSSRFGKFIRISFTRSGQIAGALIDWYLLEKSRVVRLNHNERNYHIFYQLLQGADERTKDALLLGGMGVDDFAYTRDGNDVISGMSDRHEWEALKEAFFVMGFSDAEQKAILRTAAVVLHLGNIGVVKESLRADQAALAPDADPHVAKVCRMLGIQPGPFIQALLHPRVKAGREWVQKVQTPEQVRFTIDALAKSIYERGFGDLVSRINSRLDQSPTASEDSYFIGVLDIAGFEIFEENSFEQLCINYTNEKLQQFFNHHMFVLEQEEYAREKIEWKFIDFGKELQPTIELIELPNPVGIFSCLDEDCVMPKATDKTFTEKLHSLWDKKSPRYKRSLLKQGFMLTHYAAEVEYSTEGWLDKNKDPLNDNVTRLLADSKDSHFAALFADCADNEDDSFIGETRSSRRGLFRTVAQRHKEQLFTLMNQLHSTHPHFVRCIIPNHKKRPKMFSTPLVLDQLRCNGVLEGIRIARTGFPNRLFFAEFRERYGVLLPKASRDVMDGQLAVKHMLTQLKLDSSLYRVGITKLFFRAGVLAELEVQRDAFIAHVFTQFQSNVRACAVRKAIKKRLYRTEAALIIQRNLRVYLDLQSDPWWLLYSRMKPLLGETRPAVEVKKRDETIHKLEQRIQNEAGNRQRLEEDRRRAEHELQKINQTLASERALALDKEEIFKRLQKREVELGEKLSGALEDQEKLEDQLDSLMAAKKKAESQNASWSKELKEAGQIIHKLEGEKGSFMARVGKLEDLLSSKDEEFKAFKATEKNTFLPRVEKLESLLSNKEQEIKAMKAAEKDNFLPRIEKLEGLLSSKEQEIKTIRAAEKNTFLPRIERLEGLLVSKEAEIKTVRAAEKNSFVPRIEMLEGLLSDKEEEIKVVRAAEKDKTRQIEQLSRQVEQLAAVEPVVQKEIAIHTPSPEFRLFLDKHLDTLKGFLGAKRRKVETDSELKGYSSATKDAKLLESVVKELEREFKSLSTGQSSSPREYKPVESDSTQREVQSRLQRQEQINDSLRSELGKARLDISGLMAANTDLDNTNKAHEQAAQVLERELRIEQDKFHRAERELEGWKGLRVEKENLRRRSGSFNNQAPLADSIGAGNRRTSGYSGSPSDKIIRRVSGAKERKASGTKGFL